MMEAEMDHHLGYEPYERSETTNSRNDHKPKSVRRKYDEVQLEVPQDHENSFESQIVRKRLKDISQIDEKIISMYAKGVTTRQISEQIEN